MNKIKMAGIGGVTAAGVSSVCCVGPVALAGMGFGAGAIGAAQGFGVLHWPMLILAALLLGTAFYFHFGKTTIPVLKTGSCEMVPGQTRQNQIVLWAAAAATLFLAALPYVL